MRFLRRWLHVERPPGVALHPSKTIDLDMPAQAAFERAVHGIDFVLGGAVRESNAQRGTIEATFGLVNSERMTVSVTAIDESHARVVIESRRGVSGQSPPSSQYVDALAAYLQR